jgi:hypothetical protein
MGQALFAIALGIFGGNLPAFLVSMFEPHLCYSGVGLSYNVAHAVFSGTAPIIQTSLVLSGDQPYSSARIYFPSLQPINLVHDGRFRPAFYLMAVATLSLITLVVFVPYVRAQKALRLAANFDYVTAAAAIDSAIDPIVDADTDLSGEEALSEACSYSSGHNAYSISVISTSQGDSEVHCLLHVNPQLSHSQDGNRLSSPKRD